MNVNDLLTRDAARRYVDAGPIPIARYVDIRELPTCLLHAVHA